MLIRKIRDKDAGEVSLMCSRSFKASIAESLNDEGRETFSKIADSNAFLERMKQDNIILVAVNEHQVLGVIELKARQHIAMLFVDPHFQNKGIGRALFNAILPFVNTATLTVSASLASIDVYKKYGFKCAGEVSESAGLVYQPMTFESVSIRYKA
jgi:predicted N-acetyltransferase YhbS